MNIGHLIVSAGKVFGSGALSTAGGIAISAIAPFVIPKIESMVRDIWHNYKSTRTVENVDPDLC